MSDDVDGGRTRPQAERKGLAREPCRGFPYLINKSTWKRLRKCGHSTVIVKKTTTLTKNYFNKFDNLYLNTLTINNLI